MRIPKAFAKITPLCIVLLIVTCRQVHGQYYKYYRRPLEGQVSFGLANGTLNFQQSVNAGFALGFGVNLLSIGNSSLSLGTNIKFGFENKDGAGYGLLALLLLVQPPASDISANFAEFPLALHYNYGWGSSSKSYKNVGFYFGGGISYVITGYGYGANSLINTSFWGYTADAGIRVKNFELGFSKVFSLGGGVTGINTPAFYELTLSVFTPTWKKDY